MKILAQIPHHSLGITLFFWNEKYLLKFEQGDLEQTYKVSTLEGYNEEMIKFTLEDEDFIQKVEERFKEMRKDFYQALD